MSSASGGTARIWKLEDAKAHLSEVVRHAKADGPQHVTVHGKPAVVVVSAEEYARLVAARERPSLHALLSTGPLGAIDLDPQGVRAQVREVEL